MRHDVLITLIGIFAPLSIVSVGGGMAVLPAMQHQLVDVKAWITANDFINFFAITRVAPGPGTMLATIAGWHVAGWWGALVATLAFYGPSSLMCMFAVGFSESYRDARWHKAAREGLAPLGIGLILSGVISVIRLSANHMPMVVTIVAAAAAAVWFPKMPTLLLLSAGAVVYAASMSFI